MANELKHGTVGTELTQAEWESITAHVLDAQVTGDIIYAASATQLRRLGIGASNTVLAVSGGIPAWVAGPTFGATTTIQGNLVIDLGGQTLTLTHGIAASHQLTFPDPLGNDSFVYLALAQTLTSKTLTAPVIQGTVGAGTGLTMPAFTGNGNIGLGANSLLFTDILLKRVDANFLGIFDSDGVTYHRLRGLQLRADSFLQNTAGNNPLFYLGESDGEAGIFLAHDTGVADIEIARGQGAADPYFEIYPLRLKPIATVSLPATPVEGMLVYDDTANKLKVYNGAAWETVTSA